MRKLLIAALPCVLAAAMPAKAGPATDALGQCLAAHTTSADRIVMVKWIFSVMAAHPEVASMSKVTDAQRADFAAGTGKVMERLLTLDCRAQTVAAIRADGISAIKNAFQSLGATAMGTYMQDPSVGAALASIAGNVDAAKLAEVFVEAGAIPK